MKEKGSYIDAKKDSLWTTYYNNGQLKEKGSYIENIKDGYWERFSNNGWNMDKGLWENGKREGLWEFFVKGPLNWKGNFVGGKTTKLWENYYIRGRKFNFLKKPTF